MFQPLEYFPGPFSPAPDFHFPVEIDAHGLVAGQKLGQIGFPAIIFEFHDQLEPTVLHVRVTAGGKIKFEFNSERVVG